jgi:poly(A) polymerase
MGNETLSLVPWSDELGDYFNREVSFGSTGRQLLKLAALLHDIAKPQTMTRDIRGRRRFFGHGSQGAEATVIIMEKLRFSTRETRLVASMVEHHLRPGQLSQGNELPSRRAIYRYFRDTGESGVDVLFLSLADHLATRGPNLDLDGWRVHTREVAYILEQRYEQVERTTVKRLIDGHDLIDIFGLEPGRTIGEILGQVKEAQATGEVIDRESALRYIRKLLEQRLIPHG